MAELHESPPKPTHLDNVSSHNNSFISDDTESTFVRSPSASFSRTISSPRLNENRMEETSSARTLQPSESVLTTPSGTLTSTADKQTKPNRKTARLFFAALCCMFLFQFAFVSGYTPSILSALEVRYGLSSTQVAVVISAYDIGGLIAAIPVSYIGGSAASRIGHRPMWIGVAGLFMALASVIWALPHFIGGLYLPDDSSPQPNSTNSTGSASSQYCSADSSGLLHNSSSCTPHSDSAANRDNSAMALAIFVVGHALSGMSAMAPLSLGPPYMQDGLNPASFAIYLGILYSTTAIGPVLGFGLGAACQSLFVDLLHYLIAGTTGTDMPLLTPSNPSWVGAWWLGYIILAFCLALSSIPFFFFPRSLTRHQAPVLSSPGSTLTYTGNQSINSETVLIDEKEDEDYVLPSLNEAPRELASSAWSLITNPVWILNNIIFIAVSSPVNGFVAYLKKYMESMFGYSAPVASLLMGGILVPAAALGVLGGGFINKRFGANFTTISMRHLAYAGFACAALVIMMLVRCPNAAVVGVHVPYFSRPKDVGPLSDVGMVIGVRPTAVGLTAECNDDCSCNPSRYDPICGSDGFTYFSACYAGCPRPSVISDTTPLTACSCIANSSALQMMNYSISHGDTVNSKDPSFFGSALPGACTACLTSAAVFLAVTFVATLSMSFGHNGVMLMLLRSIPRSRRALSLGLHNVLFKLFAAIPAPLLFGHAVDSACIYTSSSGCNAPSGSLTTTGTYCLLYDADLLATAVFGLAFGYCGIAAIFLFILFGYLTRKKWSPYVQKYMPGSRQRKGTLPKNQCRRCNSTDDVGSTGDPLAEARTP